MSAGGQWWSVASAVSFRECQLETRPDFEDLAVDVNAIMEALLRRQPPPLHRGRRVQVKYATQITVAPPTFAIFSNFPKALPASYVRFLHNGFRDAWTFMGTPIRLRLRSGKDK